MFSAQLLKLSHIAAFRSNSAVMGQKVQLWVDFRSLGSWLLVNCLSCGSNIAVEGQTVLFK